MGTVQAICYHDCGAPPDLPVAVTVLFDRYSGPILPDDTVPIVPLHRTWLTSGLGCDNSQGSRPYINQALCGHWQERIFCWPYIWCHL